MRFSRRYERSAEFRSRCLTFDFAAVAHAVVDIALATRAKLLAMKKALIKKIIMKRPAAPAPIQMVLELLSIKPKPQTTLAK